MRSCSGSSIPSILNNGAISNKEIPLWQDIRHGGICFIHGSSDLSQVLQRTVLNHHFIMFFKISLAGRFMGKLCSIFRQDIAHP